MPFQRSEAVTSGSHRALRGPGDCRAAFPLGALELVSPRVATAAVLALFGFGVFAGTLAGPRAGDTLASSRRVIVVDPPPAPAAQSPPAATPEPAPAPAQPDTSPAGDGGGSTSLADSGAGVPAQPIPSAPQAPAAPQDGGSGGGGADTPATTQPAGPPVKHVWIIALADHSFDQAFGPQSPATYLARDLTAKGLLIPNYYAIAHGSLANGIALLSGQGPNPDTQAECPQYSDFAATSKTPGDDGQLLGRGCVFPATTQTLPGQLTGAGRTWKAYVEDMGNVPPGQASSCRHPAAGAADPFAAPRPGDASLTWRDPFVYFHSIVDTPDCAAGVVGLDRLAPDLQDADRAPSFPYVVPNACHDGRDAPCADGAPAGLAAADAWLKSVVDPILASKAYADGGLVVITFDQAAPDGPDADSRASSAVPQKYPNTPDAGGLAKPGPGGGRVGALVLSPFVKAGTTSENEYDHYGLLRTIEDLFGLDPLGYAGSKAEAGFGE